MLSLDLQAAGQPCRTPWPFGHLTEPQQRAHRSQQQHLQALAEAAHRARVEAALQAWARHTPMEVRP